ncbi:hypothetical protein BDZ89DRAFT_1159936 [Hymenopellis radicata]|nr:hypothetical protein BDZ89DRAFT_1159936 [Hymenopellis radicata]
MTTISIIQSKPEHTSFPLYLRTPLMSYAPVRHVRRAAFLPLPAYCNRLPNELLSHIFLLTAADERDASRDPSVCVRSLASVCKRWRGVALGTGRLWTNILLTFPQSPGQLSYASTCIQRSKRYPLDIYMDFRDPDWNWDEDSHPFGLHDMEAVLGVLLPHAMRWRSLELLTDTWTPTHAFLSHTRDAAAPILETLSLSRCNAYFAAKGQAFEPAELKEPIPLFGGRVLPCLKRVSLVGVHVDWAQSELRDLLDLELKYHASDVMPSLEEFADILSACPDIRHLSILGWGPRFDGLPRAVIRLSKLIRFSLGLVDNEYAIDLLSCMSFPVLQELALEDVSSILDPVNEQDVTPILDRFQLPADAGGFDIPSDKVQILELHNVRSNPAAIERFLCCFSLVHKMVLSEPGDVLIALHPVSDTAFQACPSLTELSCSGTDSIEKLFALVSARTGRNDPGVKHLQKLHIGITRDDGVEDNQWSKILDLSTCVDLSITKLYED